MKKIITLFLVVVMTISSMALLSACNSEESTKKDDTESVKDAYNSLNKAFTLTSAAMDDIYKS